MSEMKPLITMLPDNPGFHEAELKNLFRVANIHLEAFAKSRLLFTKYQNEGLKIILYHCCDKVASQSFL